MHPNLKSYDIVLSLMAEASKLKTWPIVIGVIVGVTVAALLASYFVNPSLRSSPAIRSDKQIVTMHIRFVSGIKPISTGHCVIKSSQGKFRSLHNTSRQADPAGAYGKIVHA